MWIPPSFKLAFIIADNLKLEKHFCKHDIFELQEGGPAGPPSVCAGSFL
jgi:hypothetical protein